MIALKGGYQLNSSRGGGNGCFTEHSPDGKTQPRCKADGSCTRMERQYKISRYVVVTDPVVDRDTGKCKRIIFGTRAAVVFTISQSVWQHLESGHFELLSEEIFASLVQSEILVPNEENELQSVLRSTQAAITDTDTFYQVIQPSAACQLGCGYCGQEHRNEQISDVNHSLLLKRVQQRLDGRKYRRLRVCWFGGEPLLDLSGIRWLSPRLQALASEFGCDFAAKIVTNGVRLSEAVADELIRQHRVNKIEITLDGTAEFHDKRRFTKGGQPSFDRIFRNLVLLVEKAPTEVEISVRCNVDRQNVEGVSPLLNLLAEKGMQKKISFYVAPIHSWGNDADRDALSSGDFATWELNWFAQMHTLGFKVSVLPELKPVVCMAVSPHAELIDPSGSVFNCTEVSLVPAYGNPNIYSLGTLRENRHSASAVRLANFPDQVLAGQYDCGTCAMLPVCGGSCPKQWQEGRVPCPSAKLNMKGRLLLALACSKISAAGTAAQQEPINKPLQSGRDLPLAHSVVPGGHEAMQRATS